jgi:hypothetical protein
MNTKRIAKEWLIFMATVLVALTLGSVVLGIIGIDIWAIGFVRFSLACYALLLIIRATIWAVQNLHHKPTKAQQP